jgi:hypothetical protein
MAGDKDKAVVIRDETLQNLIHTVRGVEVMLDSDLAPLYGVETKVFNQAVKRNYERFPESFRFQLTQDEFDSLRSQNVTLNAADNLRSQSVTSRTQKNLRSQIATLETGRGKHHKFPFSEQGVAMLSAMLRSETAIQTSIHIINAFVAMRRLLTANGGLLQRMDLLEQRPLSKLDKVA